MHFITTSLLLAAAVVTALPERATRSPSLCQDIAGALDALKGNQPDDQVSDALSKVTKAASAIDSLPSSDALSSRDGPQISKRASLACNIIRYIFPNDYVDSSNGTSYQTLVNENWSSNCDLPAACFVTPENPVQVAVALKVVTITGSRFAVRGGGHNTNPGWASIDGSGVLIDLQKMKTLSLSDDKKVVHVGPGNRWGDVAPFLDKYELSAVGGRHLQVGVGGVILGGGYPIFSSLYGQPCDNVENFEVVLGDSRIVQANRRENSDLFKVLKGGGNNFGIVTRFDLYTTTTHKIWYRSFALNGTDSNSSKILEAAVQVEKNMGSDPKAQLLFNAAFGRYLVTFIYAEETNNPEVFRPLEGFPEVSVPPGAPPPIPPTNGTVLDFHKLETNPDTPGYREPTGITVKPDANLYSTILKLWAENSKFSTPDIVTIIKFQPISSLAVKNGRARGGPNILGLSEEAQDWIGTPLQYLKASEATEAHDYCVRMEKLVSDAARKAGKWLRYIFMNDATYSQNVVRSYGKENLEEMRSVSRKFDRNQVFQKLQFGGYLVTKA